MIQFLERGRLIDIIIGDINKIRATIIVPDRLFERKSKITCKKGCMQTTIINTITKEIIMNFLTAVMFCSLATLGYMALLATVIGCMKTFITFIPQSYTATSCIPSIEPPNVAACSIKWIQWIIAAIVPFLIDRHDY